MPLMQMRATERNPGHNGGPGYDTATLWIKDVAAEDTGSELVSLPPNCFFAFQVDESTHGTRLTALLVFVWCSPQLTIKERWFFYLLPKCLAESTHCAETVHVEHLF